MFVKQNPAKSSLLRLTDNFFSIDKIDPDGNITCEVFYDVNQSSVIKQNASTVRITTYTKLNAQPDILKNKSGSPASPSEITRNILTSATQRKAVVKSNQDLLLSVVKSDVTAKINNAVIGSLNSGKDPKTLQTLNQTNITLKSVSDIKSNFESVAVISKNNQTATEFPPAMSVQKMIQSMIVSQGVDPSNAVSLKNERISAFANSKGLIVNQPNVMQFPKEKSSLEFSKTRQAFRGIILSNSDSQITKIDELNDNAVVHVLETKTTDQVTVPCKFILKSEDIFSNNEVVGNLYVKFELLGENGIAIDVVEKIVDLQKHIKIFNTPLKPPLIKFSKFETLSKALVEVSQVDTKANAVNLYLKVFYQSSPDVGEYTFIGKFPVSKHNGYVPILLDMNTRDTVIIRAVPVSKEGISGFEFSNVIIPGKSKIIKHAVVSTSIIPAGISISVSKFPPNVTAFKVLKRDCTLNEQDYVVVSDDVIQINQLSDDEVYSVVDLFPKTRHIYEYIVELIYNDGTLLRAGSQFIEYIPQANNIADVDISDLLVNYDIDRPDVSFKLSTKITDTNLDQIKSLLEKQGILDYFKNDIGNERESFKKLIAYNVSRTNLTLGVRENFGTVVDESFSDSQFRKINSVSALDSKYQYKYEVSVLLRAPETMLKEFVKTSKDKASGKEYSFKPSKYLHPAALLEGTIGEAAIHSARNGKDDFSFGEIGSFTSVIVNFEKQKHYVTDVAANRFNRHVNIVTWTFSGANNLIDHFLVNLVENNVKTPVGKCNANEFGKTYQFIHEISDADQGDYVYSITPVFSDYSVGDQSSSNRVIV